MSKTTVIIGLIEHLGDLIAAEPVARFYKNENLHVTWVVLERYKALVDCNPAVDEVVTVECLSEWDKFPQEAYEVVVDMHFDWRQCHVTGRKVRKRFGSREVGLDNYLDHGSLLEAFCASARIPIITDAPVIHTKPGPPLVEGRYAVMHCVPNEREREWSQHSWRMLAFDMVAAGLPVVEVGGMAMLSGVRGVTDMTGLMPIPKLVDAVRHATLFVGCESGVAHIANALRVDSLVLMGHYRTWKRYNPYTGYFKDNADTCLARFDMPVAEAPYVVMRQLALNKIRKHIG